MEKRDEKRSTGGERRKSDRIALDNARVQEERRKSDRRVEDRRIV
ncbi:MAG: hypothetical protein ACLKAO_00275 [Alkaliphilus sp.]